MSFHYLGYLIVRCGFTFEADPRTDYGYDGSVFTFDAHGRIENSCIFIQLKATDHIKMSHDKKYAHFRLSKRDVDLWQDEIAPVYLVIFDSREIKAYWIYLQKYFQQKGICAGSLKAETMTIKLETTKIVDDKAIRTWRIDKAVVLANIGQVSHG
jgi:hypothetical protein